MKSNFDKVISVPIECEDVTKTVAQLPRHPDDSHIVAVQLKRRLQLKNSHLQEYIRPQAVIKALQALKEKFANPFYQDIEIDEGFLNKPVIEGNEIEEESASQIHERELDEEYEKDQQEIREREEENARKASEMEETAMFDDNNENESTKEPRAKRGAVEDEESEDENDTRLNSVKNYQSKQENNTCLLPREMTNQIKMNTGKSTITVPTDKKSIQIAPGTYMIFFTPLYLTHMIY